MKALMRRITTITGCIVLTACASGFQQFYKPFVDARTIPGAQFLGSGEAPKVYSSNDLRRDIRIAKSKGYWPIGASSFNGQLESEQAVINQAKAVGAVLVLVNSKFAESRTITTPLFLPNNQTTYNSGYINGTYGSANYYGTSTTYGTTVVPLTTTQQRYDQSAVFFVKMTRKLRVGIYLVDLSPEIRAKLERNVGAMIDVVVEDTPAFVANVLPGDILIEINGIQVIDVRQAVELMRSVPQGKCTIKVIRNGVEKSIELQLGA